MARFQEPTPEQERVWREWVATRPEKVRAVAESVDPWTVYRMTMADGKPGHRVTLRSIYANGEVSVNVTGEFNSVVFERYVYGIDPQTLTPCELPLPGEPIGCLLTGEEADKFFATLRTQTPPEETES